MLTLKALALTALLAAPVDNTVLEEIRTEATRGDREARLELGILYEFGYGMKGNEQVALAWYMLAADAGSHRGAKRRDLLLKRLSADEIAAAKRLSAKLAKKAPPAPASAPK
jgi:TPR repeat protein